MFVWSIVALVTPVLSVAVADRLGHRLGPAREHLFETDDGDRKNPFGELSAGGDAGPTACRGCGTDLESRTDRYCRSCHALESGGD